MTQREDVGTREGRALAVGLRGITKQYPGVLACDHINLDLHQGEILALLGENGAGKSTLMNILSGLTQPDGGSILIDSEPIKLNNTRIAHRRGIGMVHQHFLLVPPLSVAENVALGAEPGRLTVNRAEMERHVEELCRSLLGVAVDARQRVEQLAVGMQQRVEILKALYRGARILILDEPTAVLTPQETLELFRTMRRMASEGRSVVFISHKLHEVLDVADRIIVLRAGRVVGETEPDRTTKAELASMMVGREIMLRPKKEPTQLGPALLSLSHVTSAGSPGLNDVSFEVRSGEVFGIAGVDGNGQLELEEVLTGLRPVGDGSITLSGRPIVGLGPRGISERGVAHIPSDRGRWGLVNQATIWENAAIADYRTPPFGRWGFIRPRAMQRFAVRLMRDFDIRAYGPEQVAGTLSGGNQQKLVVGREVSRRATVIVAAQPTRGLDVGATEFIHRELMRLRSEGKGILLISADLDDIMTLSDRIGVFYDGHLMGIRDATAVDRVELGLLMAGVRREG